jgi:hypothetical protein
MSEQKPVNPEEVVAEQEFIQSEVAEYHRLAARHFELAAKHHMVAAEADEEDDILTAGYHAYVAHGHQLRAVEYAAIAAEDAALAEDEECSGCDSDSCTQEQP